MGSYDSNVLAELASPAPAELSDSTPLTFSYIFRTHAAYVLGLVRRLGVSASDAEDVAQEVFLAVHSALPQFERRSKLKTWLCSICLHKVQDYRRQTYRRREAISAELPALLQPDTPHESLLRKQRVGVLEAIVARLPDTQRQVFVLFEVEGLSMSDIARMLDRPLFTAYGWLRLAKLEVRKQFERATAEGCP